MGGALLRSAVHCNADAASGTNCDVAASVTAHAVTNVLSGVARGFAYNGASKHPNIAVHNKSVLTVGRRLCFPGSLGYT